MTLNVLDQKRTNVVLKWMHLLWLDLTELLESKGKLEQLEVSGSSCVLGID